VTVGALGAVGLAAGTGLAWPAAAHTALGGAYLITAGLYLACLWPSFSRVPDAMRLPLRLIGSCASACAIMYVAWGAIMIAAPQYVTSQGSGPSLVASFLFGLWLNLVATSGYLLRVPRRLVGEIEQHALVDPLTGASNRRGLRRYLEGAASGGRGLVAIDIDHFKRINDGHGHAAGDHVLAVCAERLRAQLRDGDLLAGMGARSSSRCSAAPTRPPSIASPSGCARACPPSRWCCPTGPRSRCRSVSGSSSAARVPPSVSRPT
jgi:hypothetical protein